MGGRRRRKKTLWRPKPKVRRSAAPPKNPNVRFVCPSTPEHVFDFRIRAEDVGRAGFHCVHDGYRCEKVILREVRPFGRRAPTG